MHGTSVRVETLQKHLPVCGSALRVGVGKPLVYGRRPHNSNSGPAPAIINCLNTSFISTHSVRAYINNQPASRARGQASRLVKASILLSIRVRADIIGHARKNMYVNLSHAWL